MVPGGQCGSMAVHGLGPVRAALAALKSFLTGEASTMLHV